MEFITFVCLAQSIFLIAVGAVAILGVTTATVKHLTRDATQLAAAFRAWHCGERALDASLTIARWPRSVGHEHGLVRAVRTLIFDFLAAASLVGLSGYIAWNAAF